MEQLLLVNPSKRKTPKRRKTRTAAQKAATRKLVALNRARRAPARKTYASNPAPHKRRARRAASPVAAVRRVHRRHTRKHTYTRNPAPRNMMGVMQMLKGGFQGGLGAVAINTIYAKVPLPTMLKTGNMSYVGKAAFAIALGLFGRKVLPGNVAARMAEGSLAVTFHDAIVNIAGGMMPSIGLGDMGYYPGGFNAEMPMMNTPAPQLGDLGRYERGNFPHNAGNEFSQRGEYSGMGEYVN